MRIAFGFDIFYPESNGVITTTINLANNLIEMGHEVYFFVPADRGFRETTIEKGIHIIRVKALPSFIYKGIKLLPIQSWYLRKYFMKYKFDVIHDTSPWLICQAMTAESGADFTIVNGGGIRASLSAGPVTIGNVNDVLPFTNIITVCSITPAGVYEALEHGYSLLPEQNGAFSQTDLSVVYSASAPAGERIKKVILNGTVLDRNDTVTEYKVATNDFMAAGGDGYTMFGNVLSEGSMLNEVFMDYISGLYPVR